MENEKVNQSKLQEEISEKLSLTKAKKNILVGVLLLMFVFSGMVFSLQAPFYPEEAKSKNLTAFEIGIVFGSFQLAECIFSFPSGKIAFHIGSKLVVILGTVVTSLVAIAFGMIPYIHDKTLFFTASVLLRIIDGTGQMFMQIGIMTIITTALPKYSGTVIAWTESMFGMGMIIAPAVGGFLFDVGGYSLPFEVLGGVTFLMLPLIYYIVPSDSALASISTGKNVKSWSILLIPAVWFGLLCTMSGFMALTLLGANLGMHLEVFDLSGTYRGLIFLLFGLGYAGSSPIWGKLCLGGLHPLICMLIGNICLVLGLCLIGPAPFIPMEKSLELIIPGLTFVGVGVGGCVPTSFVYIKDVCTNSGYESNIDTNAFLSGIFMTALTFGSFIGPVLFGLIYDYVGFANGILWFMGCHIIVAIMSIVTFYVERNSKMFKSS